MNVVRWRESVTITVRIVYKKLNYTQLLVKTQPHNSQTTEASLLDNHLHNIIFILRYCNTPVCVPFGWKCGLMFGLQDSLDPTNFKRPHLSSRLSSDICDTALYGAARTQSTQSRLETNLRTV